MCRTCSTGYFQADYAQTECEGCQVGFSTLFRGANSGQECKEECPPGKTSETGLEPCFPCPKGYFQPESGTEHCFKCPNKVALTPVSESYFFFSQTTTIFQASFSIEDCIGLDNTQNWVGLTSVRNLTKGWNCSEGFRFWYFECQWLFCTALSKRSDLCPASYWIQMCLSSWIPGITVWRGVRPLHVLSLS